MAHSLFTVALIAFIGLTAAVPSRYPVHFVPEHRSQLVPLKTVEQLPYDNYEYTVIPADAYSVAEFVDSSEPTIWDYIPVPNLNAAIASVASKAAAVGTFVLVKGGLVFLGAALVIAFCAFTPYCTLVIEKPVIRQIRSYVPYLDDMEHFFRQAYDKYHDM